jgi:putative restriction endonuclease
MFAISPTDNNWFKYLRSNSLNSYVNFWTPTGWDVKGLQVGDRLYFMLKSPIRKIAGFGEFIEYKNITADSAWNTFGLRNGTGNGSDFIGRIQGYLDKNSQKYGGTAIAPDHMIGNIVLNNSEFWDENEYEVVTDCGVEFPVQIVKIKYFKQADAFKTTTTSGPQFQLVTAPREPIKIEINSRSGQGGFKVSY